MRASVRSDILEARRPRREIVRQPQRVVPRPALDLELAEVYSCADGFLFDSTKHALVVAPPEAVRFGETCFAQQFHFER